MISCRARMRLPLAATVVATVALAAACAADPLTMKLKGDAVRQAQSPAWSSSGYDEPRFGWRLPFQDAAGRRLVNGPWRLANWIETAPGRWEPRRDPGYMHTVEVDDDGDGRVSDGERRA